MNEQHTAREVFHQLLVEGVDKDLIIAGSSAYAQQVKRTGERPLPLKDWLQQRGWEQHRH
jgi:hypothetical protein